MKVFLCGEGPHDIGDWSKEAPYRSQPPAHGIVGKLLLRVRADAEIHDGCCWKRIRKYQAGGHRSPEQRNVLGLTLQAREAGCAALAFARDRDGDPQRERAVEEGITVAKGAFPMMQIIGGVAIEELEAWILALHGERRSESHTDPKSRLAQVLGDGSFATMAQVVEEADLDRVPKDAVSLLRWLGRAGRGAVQVGQGP